MGSIFTTPCRSEARLDGKTAVITGANTGIGKETAKDFYLRGAKVILACRNITKADEAVKDIRRQCIGKQNLGELATVHLDLSSLTSVRTCAELLNKEARIEILVNNAGLFGIPYGKSEDGFEMNLGTNHLGHFLLTLLLLPKIIESGPARIVTVSSMLHTMVSNLDFKDLNYENRKYRSIKAYSESKLANILFSTELARKLKENNIFNVNTYSLHPGLVKTEVGRYLDDSHFQGITWFWNNIMGIFNKTPQQGAQTSIFCAVDEKCSNETGLYYQECSLSQTSRAARDERTAQKLWDISWDLVGLENDYNPFINSGTVSNQQDSEIEAESSEIV